MVRDCVGAGDYRGRCRYAHHVFLHSIIITLPCRTRGSLIELPFHSLLDGHLTISPVTVELVPLLTHQARVPKKRVHAAGVAVRIEEQEVAQRQVGLARGWVFLLPGAVPQ